MSAGMDRCVHVYTSFDFPWSYPMNKGADDL